MELQLQRDNIRGLLRNLVILSIVILTHYCRSWCRDTKTRLPTPVDALTRNRRRSNVSNVSTISNVANVSNVSSVANRVSTPLTAAAIT